MVYGPAHMHQHTVKRRRLYTSVCCSLVFCSLFFLHAYTTQAATKILIVPGHDPLHSGAIYRDVTEASLNLALAQEIQKELIVYPDVQTVVARGSDGHFIPEIDQYVVDNKTSIIDFIHTHVRQMKQLLHTEDFTPPKQIPHGNAPKKVVHLLYGINKWVTEQDFDLVIHIHFDNYYRRAKDSPGIYTGYTVYIPEDGLLGAKKSSQLGQAIAQSLKRVAYPTNISSVVRKGDKNAVVKDFSLIAMGANNTSATPRALIEFAYMYEPQIQPSLVHTTFTAYAQAAAKGIATYLGHKDTIRRPTITYQWPDPRTAPFSPRDILMMQFALRDLGYFTPIDSVRCAFNGIFSPCTKQALQQFQYYNSLETTSTFDLPTVSLFNAIYSARK